MSLSIMSNVLKYFKVYFKANQTRHIMTSFKDCAKVFLTQSTSKTQCLMSLASCYTNYNLEDIFQIVGVGKWCDQNGDRVSKSKKSSLICMIRPKKLLVEYEKYGTLSKYELIECKHMMQFNNAVI